jgi:hypothetical protein
MARSLPTHPARIFRNTVTALTIYCLGGKRALSQVFDHASRDMPLFAGLHKAMHSG